MTKSELQKSYRKERNRAKGLISRWKKRGYIFDKELVPPIPKRITEASIRRLKKITADTVYNAAFGWVEPRTGEVLTPQQGRSVERKKSRKKMSEAAKTRIAVKKRLAKSSAPVPTRTDNIIQTTQAYILQDIPLPWAKDRQQILLDLFEASIVQYGRDAVADRIARDTDHLQELIMKALTESDDARAKIAIDAIAEILKGDKLTTQEEEEINDLFETDIGSEFL